MKAKKLFIPLVCLAFLLTGSSLMAATLSINAPESVSLGGTFGVGVVVDDATDLGGAALTLQYDSTLVAVVEGGGMLDAGNNFDENDTFHELVEDQRTPPGDPAQAYPIIGNDVGGKVMLSGAYVDPSTGAGAYTGEQTLFTVKFQVLEAAVDGNTVEFSLMKTTLDNSAAGWNGEEVHPLVGVNANWNDTPGDVSDDFYDIEATFPASPTSTAITSFIKGDIDGSNAEPDVLDVRYLLFSVQGYEGFETLSANGDIDKSGGEPDVLDVRYLLFHVQGYEGYETLP